MQVYILKYVCKGIFLFQAKEYNSGMLLSNFLKRESQSNRLEMIRTIAGVISYSV